MFATMTNPAAAYRNNALDIQVETASPHRLVVMLYDGALMALAAAAMHIKQKETAKKGKAISHAISIIDGGLKASLDRKAGGDLAEKLAALYEYMCIRLLQANLNNDIGAVNEVSGLLKEIKSAWEEIANDPAVLSPTKAAA